MAIDDYLIGVISDFAFIKSMGITQATVLSLVTFVIIRQILFLSEYFHLQGSVFCSEL